MRNDRKGSGLCPARVMGHTRAAMKLRLSLPARLAIVTATIAVGAVVAIGVSGHCEGACHDEPQAPTITIAAVDTAAPVQQPCDATSSWAPAAGRPLGDSCCVGEGSHGPADNARTGFATDRTPDQTCEPAAKTDGPQTLISLATGPLLGGRLSGVVMLI